MSALGSQSASSRAGRDSRFSVVLQLLAFGLILFGVKLWLVNAYGNDTPYLDQWDAEAAVIFEPFLRGNLPWRNILAVHNEHHILTTRLISLGLLQLNGLWSSLLEMVVNAAIHVFSLGVMVCLLARVIGRRFLPALLVFVTLVFAVPYGWENTLAGFQTQFYLVLLFSVLAIWFLMRAEVFTAWWWLGITFCVTAYFSFASGLFAAAAAAAALAVRGLFTQRSRSDFLAFGLLGALFFIGYLATPVLAHHAGLKATGLGQFTDAFLQTLAWPGQSHLRGARLVAALFRNLPWLIFIAMTIRLRPPRMDLRWYLVALGLWVCGQAASVAYGRTLDALNSRYLDLHAMALLVDFAALIAVAVTLKGRWRLAWAGYAVAWLAYVGVGLAMPMLRSLPVALEARHQNSLAQQKNVRAYLANGDMAAFAASNIPYPDSDRLASILGQALIRAVLPHDLQPQLTPGAVENVRPGFVANGFHPGTAGCACAAFGSYGPGGDSDQGETRMHYSPLPAGGLRRSISIPIAGYPSRAGGIEVVQDGVSYPLRLRRDPGERWIVATAAINDGPFEIRGFDHSASSWLAVGQPVMSGRLDVAVAAVLHSSLLFSAVGLVLLLILLVLSSVPTHSAASTCVPDPAPNCREIRSPA